MNSSNIREHSQPLFLHLDKFRLGQTQTVRELQTRLAGPSDDTKDDCSTTLAAFRKYRNERDCIQLYKEELLNERMQTPFTSNKASARKLRKGSTKTQTSEGIRIRNSIRNSMQVNIDKKSAQPKQAKGFNSLFKSKHNQHEHKRSELLDPNCDLTCCI